jgi:hypothetical protein
MGPHTAKTTAGHAARQTRCASAGVVRRASMRGRVVMAQSAVSRETLSPRPPPVCTQPRRLTAAARQLHLPGRRVRHAGARYHQQPRPLHAAVPVLGAGECNARGSGGSACSSLQQLLVSPLTFSLRKTDTPPAPLARPRTPPLPSPHHRAVQHAPHDPYEVPQAYLDKFSHVDQVQRRYYSAMVNLLDDHVGVVVAALKAKGMWDNLLWVSSSDNGGPVGSGFGGNNWPLAGGKASNWEVRLSPSPESSSAGAGTGGGTACSRTTALIGSPTTFFDPHFALPPRRAVCASMRTPPAASSPPPAAAPSRRASPPSRTGTPRA